MRKITCISAINGGAPTIDGTRLTCANVSLFLKHAQIARMLAVHPYLAHDDLEHALRYCAKRECLADRPANYCTGCSLDRRPRDADEPAPIDVWEVSGRLLSGGSV